MGWCTICLRIFAAIRAAVFGGCTWPVIGDRTRVTMGLPLCRLRAGRTLNGSSSYLNSLIMPLVRAEPVLFVERDASFGRARSC